MPSKALPEDEKLYDFVGKVLSGMFLAQQSADILMTPYGIKKGYSERNPIVKPIAGDPYKMAAMGAALTALEISFMKKARKKYPGLFAAGMVGANILYAGILAKNLAYLKGK